VKPHSTESSVFYAARKRAARSSFFLAFDLDAYATLIGWTDIDLAQALGCSLDTLNLIALCRTPRRDTRFGAEIEAIGSRFQINSIRLAALLREIDIVREFEPVPHGEGWLAAARDRGDQVDDDR
jgi:hypothetical protein